MREIIFLVITEKKKIICINGTERAKTIVARLKRNGISLGIFGAENLRKFLMFNPSYSTYKIINIEEENVNGK